MAILIGDALRELDKSVSDAYREAFLNYKSAVADLITKESIGSEAFVHPFSLGISGARLWEGERIVKSVQLGEITGKTNDYENTFGVPVNKLLSDAVGRYVQDALNLGRRAATFYDDLLAGFLSTGSVLSNSNVNYDGKAIFAVARSLGNGSTQANLFGSRPLSYDNLLLSYSSFRQMKREDGTVMDIKPTKIIVPSALEMTARAIINNEFISDGTTTTSNVLRGMLEIVVLPALSSATTWYLVSDDHVKPFVAYEFRAPELVSKNQPTDDGVFYHKEAVYGWQVTAGVQAAPYQFVQMNQAAAL